MNIMWPTCKVQGYKVFSNVWSVVGWSKSETLILASNPDIRSARFYGQFSLDKTWTLHGGSSVYKTFCQLLFVAINQSARETFLRTFRPSHYYKTTFTGHMAVPVLFLYTLPYLHLLQDHQQRPPLCPRARAALPREPVPHQLPHVRARHEDDEDDEHAHAPPQRMISPSPKMSGVPYLGYCVAKCLTEPIR